MVDARNETRFDVCCRADWAALATKLLLALRPYFLADHSGVNLPGPTSSSGHESDLLEGYARSFMLAAFLLAGNEGADPDGFADFYRAGLVAGTDPENPNRWPQLADCAQARVEAAAIALSLDLTRPLIWDRLNSSEQRHVRDWLAPAASVEYIDNNWRWFRIVTLTFLVSVDPQTPLDAITTDLERLFSFDYGDGWISDGPRRSFDHYVGWALHFYPALWQRMQVGQELSRPYRQRFRTSLQRYLDDALHLIGADGQPLFTGRSLTYRFATAAPFWAGIITEAATIGAADAAQPLAPAVKARLGQLKRAARLTVRHFLDNGVPDADGLLNIGWFGQFEPLRQLYSGACSPYWAAKGMVGLILPASDPFWQLPEAPLPIETGDFLRVIPAPGWVVSGTRADGIVRVINHGSDAVAPGRAAADNPLYAGYGYATVTAPPLGTGQHDPLAQAVSLISTDAQASHRSGMELVACGQADGVAYAASTGTTHWVRPAETTLKNALGLDAETTVAGVITVVSLVRAEWELRLISVDQAATNATVLRVSGWPLHGSGFNVDEAANTVSVDNRSLVSRLVTLTAPAAGQYELLFANASPFGGDTIIPAIDVSLGGERWKAVAVCLGQPDCLAAPALQRVTEGQGSLTVSCRWGDGQETETIIQWNQLCGTQGAARHRPEA